MRGKRGAAALAALAALAVAVFAVIAVTGQREREREREHEAFHPKEALLEHEQGGVREAERASTYLNANEAYPRDYVESRRALAARRTYFSTPRSLGRSTYRSLRADAITTSWQELGPVTPAVPATVSYTHHATLHSGRITAMAMDPNCGQPHKGCRLYVAAAGGGVWRTDDAVADHPVWVPASNGLDTQSFGSIVVDPTDPTGNTVYAGSGEPNGSGDSEAGLGLYKSTDGGGHWALVPGSRPVAIDRSVASIAIDPRNPAHIFIGTGLARHGSAHTNGGRRTPPNAPTLGLYESTDGGNSFSLVFSKPANSTDPGAGTGTDWFQGGVNEVKLDPMEPDTVYVALFGYGIWRRSPALDHNTTFHQVFQTMNPDDTFGDRTQFDLAELPDPDNNPDTNDATVRIYAGDSSDDIPESDLWRTDDANRPAAVLAGGGLDNAGWTKLSDPTNGTPGFTSFNYCQGQCGYDDPVVVDPSNPDIVWLGGQMAYDEIPGAEGGTPRSFGRAVVRSTDAGVSFQTMNQDLEGESLHPDIHDIVMDPYNPDWAFIGSDGGVHRIHGKYVDRSDECDQRKLAPDDLADCKIFLAGTPTQIDAINDGLRTLQFQFVTFNPNDPVGDLAGGTQDNGTWTSANGWTESIGGDGGMSAIGLDGVVQHTYTNSNGDVNFHGRDPNTWDYNTQPMDDSGENSSFYSPVIADPAKAGTMFFGMQHVWRTTDNGGDQAQLDAHCRDLDPLSNLPIGDRSIVCGDWEPIGQDLSSADFGDRSGHYVVVLGRSAADTGTLWAGTRIGRLFISKNADDPDASKVSFTRIDKSNTPGRFVSGIAVDPADPNHAWVSYTGYNAYTPDTPGHVFDVRYHPDTGTADFTDLSYDLGDLPITDVVEDAPTGDLYISSDFGVLRLPKDATSWERPDAGLPPVTIYGLSLAPNSRLLYAATHGRGVWRLDLPQLPGSGGGGGGGGGGGQTPGTTHRTLRITGLHARLRKIHRRRYVRVQLRTTNAATVLVRVRNEHKRLVGQRVVRTGAGRLKVFRVLLRKGVRIHHHKRWTIGVRARDDSGAVATKYGRFRV